MKDDITLYHYWRSSASWRVRWALALKKIKYKKVHINLLASEQKSPSYLNIHTAGYVPALKIGDKVLGESLAIIEWLDEIFPQHPLLPNNSWDKAKVREFSLEIAAMIHPLQNLSVRQQFESDPHFWQMWSNRYLGGGLAVCEKLAQKTAGTFVFGSQISLADLCLIPQIYNAKRNNFDLSSFPTLTRIYDYCLKTKECLESSPEKQEESTVK